MMARRTARERSQLPTCYYEGYLEKRSFKDKTSRKLWACLCGNTLFFFNEKRDSDYIEKVELSGMISITDDGSQDRNLDAARLNLQMKDRNIKFTAPNAEARELWKGFIRSVAELSVPSSLNLLPGQILMLKDAVEKEKERIKLVAAAINSSTYITLQEVMPACYHAVSRLEAELLLERESKRGNVLLRPGRNVNSFAVTTRQDLEGSVFRHYRISHKPDGGFAIEVENPIPCATLHDVINYLVETTDGVLIPLIIEEAYEKRISYIQSDNENGEISVRQAPENLVPPSIPPKPVSLRKPEPEPIEEDNVYLNDQPEEKETESEDSSAVPLPQLEKKATRKAIMPPTPAPRMLSTISCPSSSNSPDLRLRRLTEPTGQIPFAAMSELKLRLEQKVRCQE
ncbi:Signal-transducing adaptor protein 2 [Dissostichus eleginoides]|uniref:Signal-transducing adaptor protein 2 n=1 Tax=Dissostichus eleginoides TaxID=100907 RepID=A0AAD9CA53_DISEL|nr:Signal-transducing adaptor protein 2 [Dissostichus eleginoides]